MNVNHFDELLIFQRLLVAGSAQNPRMFSNVLEFVFSVQVPSIVLELNSMFSNVLETKCLENAVILAVYWHKELNRFAHPTTSGKKKARPEQLPNECSAAVGLV